MRTMLRKRASCILMTATTLLAMLLPTMNAGATAPSLLPGVPVLTQRHGDASDSPANHATSDIATHMVGGQAARADRIIVRFRDGVSPQERSAVHSAVAVASKNATPSAIGQLTENTQTVSVPATLSPESLISAYRADSHILYAQPDYVRYATDMPNDPSFAAQWGLTKVNAPAAWSVTHGAVAIKIAILDCGIDATHPDLTGKVALAQDFTNSAFGTDDHCNHGTHVAGIASALTDNRTGVAGMGYDTQLLNGKVLDDGGVGSDSTIVAGINWAAANGAKVINLSLSGSGACSNSPAIQDAVNAAWSNNVVVVVAAGNTGTSDLQTPASCTNVVSVASTNSADARSSFSSYGSWVKVAAPGETILSTVNPALNNGNSYAYFSGTSMAAPLVAGLVALLWTTRYGTSAQAVVDRLTSTADHIPGTGSAWLNGRVNAGAALTISPAPTLANLSPATVTSGNGAFTLTVDGANFADGAVVQWNGGNRATTMHGNTEITAAISAADIAQWGTASVTVVNPDGQVSAALTLSITAAAPRLSAISPDTGFVTGGTTLMVHGTNFQSNATVTIGGHPATAITIVNATTITCITPAGTIGQVDVSVTNPDGQHDTMRNAFTYMLHAFAAASSVVPNAAAVPHSTGTTAVTSATPLPAPARH